MNRLFKFMPQHLNRIQVRTLTRPLQSLHFVFLEPFRGGFAGVFWIIVLLQNPSSLQLEVTNRWADIVLQDFLVDSRIHGSIYHSKSSRSWSSKTAPDHHTTTTIFYCWYDVLFLKCCVTFTPDVTGHTPSKKFNFCLSQSTEYFPKSLGDNQDVFWQNWDELSCSFWISTWCVAFEDLLVYFTLSGRSYLSDFLIANRCGNNQAWMWLEKLNSGVINHSCFNRGCGFGFCFPFIKKTLHLKTACCVYLCYLWLIFKFVWWSETLKCGKHAKKIKN